VFQRAILCALAALASGCSGGSSSLAPPGLATGVAPSSEQHAARGAFLASRTVSPFASKRAAAAFARRRPIIDLSSRGFSTFGRVKASDGYLFASDAVAGNVDVYDSVTLALEGQCPGCGGWGIKVSRQGVLAIGTSGGSVALYQITPSGIETYATCPLTFGPNGFEAEGIAFDAKGNLFAGDYPSNVIDYFSAKTIAAGCAGADESFYTNELEVVYYLAVSGSKTLLATGFDHNLNVDLASVNRKTGDDTVLQTLGNISQGTAYPGGVAAGPGKTVFANNQYGSFTEYANGGKGAALGTCTWGFDPNDYTGIALDSTGKSIWAADIAFANSPILTYAENDALPLGGGACRVDADTVPLQPPGEEYIDVAVYPSV
jgi:hypothetical protein